MDKLIEPCHLSLLTSITRAQIMLAGMQAENDQRKLQGDAPAYREEDFNAMITEEGIDYNSTIERLRCERY